MSFEFFITADGSPTLVVGGEEQRVEKMHHSQGALSESLYVYLPVLETLAAQGWPLKIFSLGFGLGYNEMIFTAWWLQGEAQSETFPSLERMDSFESDPRLREFFTQWLEGQPPSEAQEQDFFSAYDQILTALAKKFSVDPEALKIQLLNWRRTGLWRLLSKFSPPGDEESSRSEIRYTGFFYDAFSHKMTPELWSESALKNILSVYAEEGCVFATYAATGNLKRALKQLGFDVSLRPGFAGKRQCTLAIRPCQPPRSES